MKFEGGSDLFTTNRHTIHNSSAGTYIYHGCIQKSVQWGGILNLFPGGD